MSATYHCEQCGRRYVGPGDLPFTCPPCQTPNQPPRQVRARLAGRDDLAGEDLDPLAVGPCVVERHPEDPVGDDGAGLAAGTHDHEP